MSEPIISISGIRGILGESLYPGNIINYSTAFARYTNHGRIVIGRDGRLFGDSIEELVESTLFFNGCEVVNLDMVPTPTIALAVEELNADGGIAITASHNPQEWNGMKFINSKGVFFNADENKKFLEMVNQTSTGSYPLDKLKQIEYYPAFDDFHINRVLRYKSLNLRKIRQRKFKIVLDCVNSSGSFIIPKLLKKLGCKVIPVDCEGTGIFSRKPEPVPENLKKTCAEVKKNKADLGIVVDPDADRLVLINEKGEPYGEEYTIVTAVNHVLKNSAQVKRNVVVNLSTTRASDDIVSRNSGKIYKSPVGEINVIEKMKKVHAVIGGEGSGGVILPEVHYGRDSLVGIALVLSEFSEFDGKVSEYRKELPDYFISKTKIDASGISTNKLFNKIQLKFSEYPHNTEDGLRIDFEDSWVNFRKSNTEPIIRIIAEAKSKKKSEELLEKMKAEFHN